MLGLSLLLAGARRTSRRGRDARRGLKQSHRDNAAVRADRDDLIDRRDTARAYTASTLGNGNGNGNGNDNGNAAPRTGHGRPARRSGLFARRPARQAAPQPELAPQPESVPGPAAADAPAAPASTE
jgi:hypothetical protein